MIIRRDRHTLGNAASSPCHNDAAVDQIVDAKRHGRSIGTHSLLRRRRSLLRDQSKRSFFHCELKKLLFLYRMTGSTLRHRLSRCVRVRTRSLYRWRLDTAAARRDYQRVLGHSRRRKTKLPQSGEPICALSRLYKGSHGENSSSSAYNNSFVKTHTALLDRIRVALHRRSQLRRLATHWRSGSTRGGAAKQPVAKWRSARRPSKIGAVRRCCAIAIEGSGRFQDGQDCRSGSCANIFVEYFGRACGIEKGNWVKNSLFVA